MSIVNKKTVLGLHNPFDGDNNEGSSLSTCNNDEELIFIETELNNPEESVEYSRDELPVVIEETEGLLQKQDWGTYTGESLKRKISGKLRTPRRGTHNRTDTISHTASLTQKYEELADLKNVVATEQIEVIKKDKFEKQIKIEVLEPEREEKLLTIQIKREEWELKKQVLELDMQSKKLVIEFKKVQLDQLRKLY